MSPDQDPIGDIDKCLSWVKPSITQALEMFAQKDHAGEIALEGGQKVHVACGWVKMKHVA